MTRTVTTSDGQHLKKAVNRGLGAWLFPVILMVWIVGCTTLKPGEFVRQEPVPDSEKHLGSEYSINILLYPSHTNPSLRIEVIETAHWQIDARNLHEAKVEPSTLGKVNMVSGIIPGAIVLGALVISAEEEHDGDLGAYFAAGFFGLGVWALWSLPTTLSVILSKEKDKVLEGDIETTRVTTDGLLSNESVTVSAGGKSVNLQTNSDGFLEVDLIKDIGITTAVDPKEIEIGFAIDDQLSPIPPVQLDGRNWLVEHIRMDLSRGTVQSRPNFDSPVIAGFDRDEVFRVTSKQAQWARIGTDDGPGWVYMDDGTLFWTVSDHPDFRDIPETITARPDPEVLQTEAPISIEQNIPQAAQPNPEAIAVIIGNSTYRNAPDVDFAHRDATLTSKYVEQALGFLPGNILYLEDATLTDLRILFGDDRSHQGRLYDLVRKERSDVFVFYSGHGAPDPGTRTGYLMPVDGDADRLTLTGYPLDLLYQNLGMLEARSVKVVIDACFSGATGAGDMLIAQASPIGITVRNPAALIENGVVITASSGSQIASWHPKKRYGLLTYFFLKGLQGAAALNGDKTITVGEMQQYLQDSNDGLPYWARRLHGREQMPQVWGDHETVIR